MKKGTSLTQWAKKHEVVLFEYGSMMIHITRSFITRQAEVELYNLSDYVVTTNSPTIWLRKRKGE